MSIKSVILSNHLIICHPLLLLPSIFPSIRVFLNESVLHIRWPKYWSFSFSISPSSEYSRLISFRIDWLDLLAVQRTLKSLHQHHSSKASILQRSAFFRVQLSLSSRSDFSALSLDVTSSRQLLRFSVAPQLSGLPPAQLWSLSLAVTSPWEQGFNWASSDFLVEVLCMLAYVLAHRLDVSFWKRENWLSIWWIYVVDIALK